MRIAVIGSDGRYETLRDMLKNRGLTEDVNQAEMIVTPWPVPVNLPDSAKLVTCGPRNGPDGSVDLLLDEEYQREIAWMTAEGAISAAMRESDRALRGAECMVIGWGRIGKELASLLIGLGARVTVASRRESVCDEIWAKGAEWIGTQGIKAMLEGKDFVFSTSPVMLMGKAELLKADKGAIIIDLASAPYGVDIETASAMGLKAWREPGLPGRYCPVDAGRAIFESLERNGFLKEGAEE